MNKVFGKILSFISTAFGILGALSLPVTGMIFYMLVSGRVQPGGNLYHGDPAPSYTSGAIALGLSIGLIILALIVQHINRRYVTQIHS